VYSEIITSDSVQTKSTNILHQNSPHSVAWLEKPHAEPVYSKTEGLWSPYWPPYMPPTPPIPHEYYNFMPSPDTPSCVYFSCDFGCGNLDFEDSHQKRKRVQFSDIVNIRIIFGGTGKEDQDLVIDTQLVDMCSTSVLLLLWSHQCCGCCTPRRIWMSYVSLACAAVSTSRHSPMLRRCSSLQTPIFSCHNWS